MSDLHYRTSKYVGVNLPKIVFLFINPLNAELNPICHLLLYIIRRFNVYGSVDRKYIPIYIQQDATLHSLFISWNCSTCFGWCFHPSSGAHTTVSTASGICHTVTAICLYSGRVGTVWVCCGWRKPPTAHPNRFHLFHDSGR